MPVYNDQLDHIIKHNNIAALKQYVSKNTINNLNEPRATPLLLSAAAHNYEISKYLLELGANPNSTNQFGRIPLHEFVISCYRTNTPNLQFIELFKEYNTDINAKDCLGMTPFHIAACTGKSNLMKKLLAFGANPHEKSFSGSTALHYATAKNNLEAVKFLVEVVGLSINEKDNEDTTPFMTALNNKYRNIVMYFTQQLSNKN